MGDAFSVHFLLSWAQSPSSGSFGLDKTLSLLEFSKGPPFLQYGKLRIYISFKKVTCFA